VINGTNGKLPIREKRTKYYNTERQKKKKYKNDGKRQKPYIFV